MYPNKEVRREGPLQGPRNLSSALQPVLALTRESKSQEHEPAVLERCRIGGCVAHGPSDLSLYATLPDNGEQRLPSEQLSGRVVDRIHRERHEVGVHARAKHAANVLGERSVSCAGGESAQRLLAVELLLGKPSSRGIALGVLPRSSRVKAEQRI